MQKRYQIFVSSTFRDLVDERQDTIKSILDLGHIPAGMEGFPAIDIEQLKYIKKIIDQCDYYILIVAGRYGSVGVDGISFTEKEYQYAVETGKAVIAFVFEHPEMLPADKADQDPNTVTRLSAFREHVMTGRIVRHWKDRESLKYAVVTSLVAAFQDLPGIGWVRANTAASEDLLNQINDRLPPKVSRSIFKHAMGAMYYKTFEYEVELTHADHNVTYSMKVVFEIVNVSDRPQTVVNRYPTTARTSCLVSASVEGHQLDLDDPSLHSGDAVVLSYTIPRGQSSKFEVSMIKSFSEEESDLFTAYLYPAEKFRFRALNRSASSLTTWLEMLHNQDTTVMRNGNVLEWTAEEPILPNQGVRLLWRSKNGK